MEQIESFSSDRTCQKKCLTLGFVTFFMREKNVLLMFFQMEFFLFYFELFISLWGTVKVYFHSQSYRYILVFHKSFFNLLF